jgi:hypothetical protein
VKANPKPATHSNPVPDASNEGELKDPFVSHEHPYSPLGGIKRSKFEEDPPVRKDTHKVCGPASENLKVQSNELPASLAWQFASADVELASRVATIAENIRTTGKLVNRLIVGPSPGAVCISRCVGLRQIVQAVGSIDAGALPNLEGIAYTSGAVAWGLLDGFAGNIRQG